MAVSSKKDTLISDAQKFALSGQFDKAVKAYEQVLSLEPAAINQRQKLAELLIKCGRNDDARKELETIGKHFSDNSFYLKAIAVYKQLQKLFPAEISLSLTLAELNARHGLVANSLSEYKLVYEYYERMGNFPEALSILARMQNIDPKSIPIKIKLAEAYIQQGKKEESYAVLMKAASSLSDLGDDAALAKIHARIQQLFPDKPDFMIEILTEQVRQGNAASAIGSIQNLLRNNPNNKQAWDLVIQAYQHLEHPQRVKIAYQHYLKFFPSEPAAMHGFISFYTAEHNLAGALELLDQYEAPLITAGFLQQLEQTYQALNKIDPVNTRIMEGLIRVATAAGNEDEIRSLSSKLHSFRAVSGGVPNGSACPGPEPVFFDEESHTALQAADSHFFGESIPEQTNIQDSVFLEAEVSPVASGTDPLHAVHDDLEHPEEEIEIEIEIDLDSPFGPPDQETGAVSLHDNWLESVGDLFDTIDTAPRGVKFGNEMENSDAQSHFDLGQAFREMGLYDEAITEFRQASRDASRLVECLIMQCACLRERGEVKKAITMLLALLKPGLSEEESCSVKYELATAYEVAQKAEEANILLNEIYAIRPDFREISLRLNAANQSESLDFSDEDLDDFGFK